MIPKTLERSGLQLALANEKIRALEAELAQRNNGECFGPFHGGFICADCARLTRDLQARAEKAELEIASCPNKYWHQSVELRGLVI